MAVAEYEASMISARTKAALGAAKARGVRLGGQRGSPERMGRMARKGNAASAIVRCAASAKRNEDLMPVIEDIRGAGFSTPQQIADGLNERGITAARGGRWSGVQIRRILKSSNEI
jgi:DNA invertase Pin-like site-specific DNA recombinase